MSVYPSIPFRPLARFFVSLQISIDPIRSQESEARPGSHEEGGTGVRRGLLLLFCWLLFVGCLLVVVDVEDTTTVLTSVFTTPMWFLRSHGHDACTPCGSPGK